MSTIPFLGIISKLWQHFNKGVMTVAVKIIVIEEKKVKSKVKTIKKSKGNSHLSNKLPKG